jgi:hypothetical protein
MDRTKLEAALAAALLLGGCQSLIGLDRPALDQPPDAGSDAHTDHDHDAGPSGDAEVLDASAAQVAACDEFCTAVGEACDGTNGAQAYNTPEACRSLCLYYDHDSTETTGATFACRADRAAQAVASKGVIEERAFVDALCAMASPGGGGEADGVAGCGSNCENFCQLRRSLCGDSIDEATCEAQCAALVDARKVNAGSDFGDRPDTVQCRLAHLSMAAAQGPAHCDHAQLNPTRRDAALVRCDLNPESVTRASLCDNYCHVVTRTCTGDSAVWDDEQQCLAVCNNELGVPVGSVLDYGQDSWGCRRAHTYTALTLLGGKPHDHCSHASLGGGGSGHCGDPCVSYCSQAAGACATAFAARFPNGQSGCVSNCQDIAGDTVDLPYTRALGEKGGNNYPCRLHALLEVLAGDPTSCEAALGGANCQ